jgi:hypothetical protein
VSDFDKEVEELVGKLKARHEYYRARLMDVSAGGKAAGQALASMQEALVEVQETNVKVVQAVAQMCQMVRDDMRIFLREVAALKRTDRKPVTLTVTRGKDDRMTGAVIQ